MIVLNVASFGVTVEAASHYRLLPSSTASEGGKALVKERSPATSVVTKCSEAAKASLNPERRILSLEA